MGTYYYIVNDKDKTYVYTGKAYEFARDPWTCRAIRLMGLRIVADDYVMLDAQPGEIQYDDLRREGYRLREPER